MHWGPFDAFLLANSFHLCEVPCLSLCCTFGRVYHFKPLSGSEEMCFCQCMLRYYGVGTATKWLGQHQVVHCTIYFNSGNQLKLSPFFEVTFRLFVLYKSGASLEF